MRHLCSFLRLVMIAVVVGAGSLAGAKPAEATHSRYTHLTWKKIAPTTAEFTFTAAFRRSGYAGRAADGFVAVGDRFSENVGGTFLFFGDGTRVTGAGGGPLTFLAVAIDPARDYVVARAVDPVTGRDRIAHTYPAPNNTADGGSPWVARLGSTNSLPGEEDFPPCCRIVTLRNNAGAYYDVQAYVDLAVNNNSPVSSLPPVIPVPATGRSFFVPALDADEHTLRFRFANAVEGGSGVFEQPPGVTIDPLTGEYTVPPGLGLGLWSTQVIIEEYDGSGNQIGQVGVDFILQVLTPGAGSAPAFDYPPTPADGTVLTAVVGRQTDFLVRASDPDGDLVTLNTTGIPSGARQVAALPVIGSPAVSQFSWTPTRTDVGAYSITYTADDGRGGFAITSVTILVIDGLDVLEPDGGEFYFVDDSMNIRWDNGGRLRTNGVKIEISRDGGLTYDPTPIVASTPDDGAFTATVTGPFSLTCRVRITNVDDPLDYGVSEADFTISDGSIVPICYEGPPVQVPDNEPAFTEIPLEFTRDLIIRSLSVEVDVTHPYVGDLELEVQHPDGTIVILHDETGEGNIDLNTVFGYGAGLTRPVQPLTVLNGRRSNGTWKLRVRDLN
ncbi:MAG: proprotein convertase P-domain-containing protein, partial [Actinomycetota bacterium]